MKSINNHILELLYKHDCVIVPSFGGFVGNYQAAKIDNTNNKFNPPVRSISFNRNLTHNDGLLIGKISRERNIAYADSKTIVDKFVSQLKESLEKRERISIEKIGYLQLNSDNNILFEPKVDINFLLYTYGLSSFISEPITQEKVIGAVNRIKAPIASSSNRKMALRAIIAIPIIALMLLIPLNTKLFHNNASLNPLALIDSNSISNEQIEESNEIINPFSEESKTIIPSTEDVISENIVAKDSQTQAIEIEKADIELKSEFAPNLQYYIIAGSFKNSKYAKQMLASTKSMGFNSQLLLASNGYFRVALDGFVDIKSANKRRYELLNDYPTCWVCKN